MLLGSANAFAAHCQVRSKVAHRMVTPFTTGHLSLCSSNNILTLSPFPLQALSWACSWAVQTRLLHVVRCTPKQRSNSSNILTPLMTEHLLSASLGSSKLHIHLFLRRHFHGHAPGQRERGRRAPRGTLQGEGGVQHIPGPHGPRVPHLPLGAALPAALLRGAVPPGAARHRLLRLAALLLHQPGAAGEHPEDQRERHPPLVSPVSVCDCLELLFRSLGIENIGILGWLLCFYASLGVKENILKSNGSDICPW
jgi:hypothetical protein